MVMIFIQILKIYLKILLLSKQLVNNTSQRINKCLVQLNNNKANQKLQLRRSIIHLLLYFLTIIRNLNLLGEDDDFV
jgi:hypothetical protein